MRHVTMVTTAAALMAAALAAAQSAPAPTPTPAPTPAATRKVPEWMRHAPKRFSSFDEWVEWMRIPRPVPKKTIVRLDAKHAWPHPAVRWKMVIVKEDKDRVWLTFPPPEDPDSMLHQLWVRYQNEEIAEEMRRETMPKEHLVNFYAPVVPPPSVDRVRFEPAGKGLPTAGLWQVGFALADLDGDGHVDIVSPPERKGRPRPHVFRGDGAGNFAEWSGLRWGKVPFDYGDVAVADVDRDGNPDLVLAVHLKNQYLCLGDGGGGFTECRRLPSPDPRLFSRAVAAADFDGDGWVDLAFAAELDYDLATTEKIDAPTVWILQNLKGKGWRIHTERMPTKFMSDRIGAADVDGDGDPDLLLASTARDWRYPVLLNQGGWKWRYPEPDEVLSSGFHFDVTVDPRRLDTGILPLVAAFQQYAVVPDLAGEKQPEMKTRTGVVTYILNPQTLRFQVEPLVLDDVRTAPVWRLAAGDVDGDGLTDLAIARKSGPVQILLGRPDGSYVLERTPELDAAPAGRVFDLALRDLDGDGRDDLVLMAARLEGVGSGGFRVWLSRPAGR